MLRASFIGLGAPGCLVRSVTLNWARTSRTYSVWSIMSSPEPMFWVTQILWASLTLSTLSLVEVSSVVLVEIVTITCLVVSLVETVSFVFALSFLVDEGCSDANVFNFKVLAIFWLFELNWLVTSDIIDCNAVIWVANDCIIEFKLLISFCYLSWSSTSCWHPGLSLLSVDICAMLWVWMAVFLSEFSLFLFSDSSSTTSFMHFALLRQTAARRWFRRCRFDGEFDFWSLTWFMGFGSRTDWHFLRHRADLCWLWRWLFKIEILCVLAFVLFLAWAARPMVITYSIIWTHRLYFLRCCFGRRGNIILHRRNFCGRKFIKSGWAALLLCITLRWQIHDWHRGKSISDPGVTCWSDKDAKLLGELVAVFFCDSQNENPMHQWGLRKLKVVLGDTFIR